MTKNDKSKSMIMSLGLMAALPMWMGAECDMNTLLDENRGINFQLQPGADPSACGQASGFVGTTFSPVGGKEVSVTVNGPVNGSRPQIVVFDSSQSVVANTGQNPTAQGNSIKFTPRTGGDFLLAVPECGANSNGNYTIKVTQRR